ncbi:uncharacterized protein LOC119042111 [Artibeus jamaicensis]|uniref:uncharacterized protein LOC119042111 n=1 Tax=Artibeus jamaicensis TaxID=9417 RepID=UPI00235A9AD3|nr:uncharacterized protein LOC119042111 [Artibeus jamaicensis]
MPVPESPEGQVQTESRWFSWRRKDSLEKEGRTSPKESGTPAGRLQLSPSAQRGASAAPGSVSLPLGLRSSAASGPGLVFRDRPPFASASLSPFCLVSSTTLVSVHASSLRLPRLYAASLPSSVPLSPPCRCRHPDFLKSMFHPLLHLCPGLQSPFPVRVLSSSPSSSPPAHRRPPRPFLFCPRLCRLSSPTAPSRAPSLPRPRLHPPPPGCRPDPRGDVTLLGAGPRAGPE